MSDTHDFDAQIDDLVERYLQFLRGKGPEPDLGHLTSSQRRARAEPSGDHRRTGRRRSGGAALARGSRSDAIGLGSRSSPKFGIGGHGSTEQSAARAHGGARGVTPMRLIGYLDNGRRYIGAIDGDKVAALATITDFYRQALAKLPGHHTDKATAG